MWYLNGVSLEQMGILGDEQAWATARGSERIQLRQNKGARSSLNAQQGSGGWEGHQRGLVPGGSGWGLVLKGKMRQSGDRWNLPFLGTESGCK